jgi:hypothetical protein
MTELREYFGASHVFWDLDSQRPAQDYVAQIEEALERSAAVVAVIGPSWLAGPLRSPSDGVRQELERAVASGMPIVPVLVGGAAMPASEVLPPALSRLPRLQAVRLDDESWTYDFARLLEALDAHGVVARLTTAGVKTSEAKGSAPAVRRFERTVRATRRRAYDAVVAASEAFRHDIVIADASAAAVALRDFGTIKVTDRDPGKAAVTLELETVKTEWLVAVAILLTPFFFAGPIGVAGYLWWQHHVAVEFFDNVERLIDGRGVNPAILARHDPVKQV